MRKLLLILCFAVTFNLSAQNYSFSKTTATYANLNGATVLENSNWTSIGQGVKVPFAFKYWGVALTDSLYLDDWGSLSLDNTYGEEISFLYDDLESRGAGKTLVSSKLDGIAPNRIFKIEFQNVGFFGDSPLFVDSANVQCWLYETSNVIEFRYGANKVKASTWSDGGAYVDLIDAGYNNVVSIENDPANPSVNLFINNLLPLVGMPANGMVYKFTPVASGIQNEVIHFKVSQNKIIISAALEIKSIALYNSNGQRIQIASEAEQLNLSGLAHGVYLVAVDTKDGVMTQKLVL